MTLEEMHLFCDAMERKDVEQAAACIHAERGMVSHFYLTDLYVVVCDLVEQLRFQTEPADIVLFERVQSEHERVLKAICELEGESGNL